MNSTIQLEESERQPCEVWTRVMGYHRPVSQFNKGKKEEHAERRHFVERPIPFPTQKKPEVADQNA